MQTALAELRLQCTSQSDQLQAQQAEESHLNALQCELAAQVATQKELVRFHRTEIFGMVVVYAQIHYLFVGTEERVFGTSAIPAAYYN